MPKIIRVTLTSAQKEELETVRDRHPKAFLRERAAALLKVASGQSLTQVAEHGLLKRHEPETVHLWVKRYMAQGVEGWKVANGRGRKAKFSPSATSSGRS
jgi:transposase